MTFPKGCVNGEFSTYEYFFGHVANPDVDVYTDVQPAEKYCVSKSWLKTNMGQL